jgi:hypothetical protein
MEVQLGHNITLFLIRLEVQLGSISSMLILTRLEVQAMCSSRGMTTEPTAVWRFRATYFFVILHRWACQKVRAIHSCSISYRIHSRNFLIDYVALHATAQGGTLPMQGST